MVSSEIRTHFRGFYFVIGGLFRPVLRSALAALAACRTVGLQAGSQEEEEEKGAPRGSD